MSKQSNELYDRYKRDQESRRFYMSAEWRRTRELILIRDNHLCQNCLKHNRIRKADVVHHIKELRDYPELAHEENNLESFCHPCHTRLHKTGGRKEEVLLKKDYVISFEANDEIT